MLTKEFIVKSNQNETRRHTHVATSNTQLQSAIVLAITTITCHRIAAKFGGKQGPDTVAPSISTAMAPLALDAST
jgi:hypothetical protein